MLNNYSGDIGSLDQVAIRRFCLERLDLYVREMFPLEPMMLANSKADMWHELDYRMRAMTIRLRASVAKGETTTESRTVQAEHQFPVFRTWWDHLKYDIIERRILAWIPLRITRNLRVKYQIVKKSWTETVPVNVTKVCPHANVKFEDRPYIHMEFLGNKF